MCVHVLLSPHLINTLALNRVVCKGETSAFVCFRRKRKSLLEPQFCFIERPRLWGILARNFVRLLLFFAFEFTWLIDSIIVSDPISLIVGDVMIL